MHSICYFFFGFNSNLNMSTSFTKTCK